VKSSSSLDWPAIRTRAAQFPEEAFEFVREGLRHTVQTLHGPIAPSAVPDPAEESRRHISGQQLCLGLKTYATQRYGMLAGLVLARWGMTCTDDFGTIVYALIDRQELRSSERDSIDDFKHVYDFAEAFGAGAAACIC
jgi:uncharacterized repeat protein (TIGR04138 family)